MVLSCVNDSGENGLLVEDASGFPVRCRRERLVDSLKRRAFVLSECVECVLGEFSPVVEIRNIRQPVVGIVLDDVPARRVCCAVPSGQFGNIFYIENVDIILKKYQK